MKRLGVRWTIGDVAPNGFEALGLSIRGAHRLFGGSAEYAVCVNTVGVETARRRAGPVPDGLRWIAADEAQVPREIRDRLDARMAEGVAWKFAPVRVFPDLHELSLDNDCILWSMPRAIEAWLRSPRPSFVIAADVRPAFGRFAPLCGEAPRNSGIRGLPPGFELAGAMAELLDDTSGRIETELDEQGAQVATLLRSGPTHVVTTAEVTICSPFHPHQPWLGTCGAHFVGLNARVLGWRYYGTRAEELVEENWRRQRPALRELVRDGSAGG